MIILTVVWHLVSAATGFTLSFSRGPVIYVFTALTMIAFAVTSLDSATKTLLDDLSRVLKRSDDVKFKNRLTVFILLTLGIINIVVLYTGTTRLFTIITCLVFIPAIIASIIYSIKFAIGNVNYENSGTVTPEEFENIESEI